jgi:NAD(P)H-hydrate epimerase
MGDGSGWVTEDEMIEVDRVMVDDLGIELIQMMENAGRTLAELAVALTRTDLVGVAAHQLSILDRMGVAIVDDPIEPELWIDAVIGYSLRGAPRGRSAVLIERMNTSDAPVLSLDLPSGIDATTGAVPGLAVDAAATLTLAAPKTGMRGSPHVGQLFVADISVPPGVFDTLGHPAPTFGPREA